MNEIQKWLAGDGDYNGGLLLFMQHSRSRAKIAYLQRKIDTVKLRYEMQKLAGITSGITHRAAPAVSMTEVLPRVLPVTVPVASSTVVLRGTGAAAAASLLKPHERLSITPRGRIDYRDLPPELQTIYTDICDRYRLMRSAHEKMKVATDDAARAQYLAQILKLEVAGKQGWEAIDRWADTGQVPQKEPAPTEVPTPPSPKEVATARTSITRNLQLLQHCTELDKREVLTAKLQTAAAIVAAAGCGFGKNAEQLRALGLIHGA